MHIAMHVPVLLAMMAASCGLAEARELKVAVATNFRAPFIALSDEFELTQGIRVRPVFGSSGLLAAQIQQGAPFDAFFSADMDRPQALVDEGLAAGPVRAYAEGRVALWTPGRAASPESLDSGRIGIPNPKLAPYGQAAVECLQALALWQSHKGRLVFGNNVAQVFHFLTAGALPAGFVALGQLRAAEAPVEGYWVCPANFHRPIHQGSVRLLRSADPKAVAVLLRFMLGRQAQAKLRQLGYAPGG